MKKCTGCGAEFDDTSKYCPYCGAEYGTVDKPAEVAEEYGWQPEKPTNAKKVINTTQGMIWHKVLLIFLVLNALRNFLAGIGYFEMVVDWAKYSAKYPGQFGYVVACTVAEIAIGVFALVVFNRLRKYRRNGPSSLKMMYIICIGVILIFQFWQSSIVPDERAMNAVTFLDLLKNILMLVVNNVYYSKRQNLFVN